MFLHKSQQFALENVAADEDGTASCGPPDCFPLPPRIPSDLCGPWRLLLGSSEMNHSTRTDPPISSQYGYCQKLSTWRGRSSCSCRETMITLTLLLREKYTFFIIYRTEVKASHQLSRRKSLLNYSFFSLNKTQYSIITSLVDTFWYIFVIKSLVCFLHIEAIFHILCRSKQFLHHFFHDRAPLSYIQDFVIFIFCTLIFLVVPPKMGDRTHCPGCVCFGR